MVFLFRPAGFKKRCDFLNDQKVTKESPGTAFDEHVACGRAHRRLVPGPLFTRAGHFGLLLPSGGLNFDRAFFYSRPTGAYCHQNLQAAAPIAHRLLHPYLFGGAVGGQNQDLLPFYSRATGTCCH